jgi:heptosyltransferase III
MNALVIRPGSLGDIALTVPALDAIRHAGWRTTLACRGAFAPFFREIGACDETAAMDSAGFLPLFTAGTDIDVSLRSFLHRFDRILSYTGEDEPFSISLRRHARTTPVFHPVPPDIAGIHASDHLLVPLEASERAGIPADGLQRPTGLDPSAMRDTVLIHPGSGSPGKNWRRERFLDLFRRYAKEHPTTVILGPAEEDQAPFWTASIPEDRLLVGPAFDTLVQLFRRCIAYCGNDSGITHCAALCGVPAIAIFGPTDPAVWGPRGPAVTVIARNPGCSPCGHRRRNCPARKCLDSIEITQVEAAVNTTITPHGKTGPVHQR